MYKMEYYVNEISFTYSYKYNHSNMCNVITGSTIVICGYLNTDEIVRIICVIEI